MGCMKCGRKTDRSKTFCDECLDKMAECPIDQNTVVNLPPRSVAPIVKKKVKIHRYFWNIEGENDTLRSKIRWLRLSLFLSLFAFALALILIFILLFQAGQLDFLYHWWPF